MNSILEVIELTKRARRSSAADRRRRLLPEPIADPCRALLAEAAALGLDFDDVLDAIRHRAALSQPSQSSQSNNSPN